MQVKRELGGYPHWRCFRRKTVYDTEGSGEYKDGILDKWCLVSENEEQWVNMAMVKLT